MVWENDKVYIYLCSVEFWSQQEKLLLLAFQSCMLWWMNFDLYRSQFVSNKYVCHVPWEGEVCTRLEIQFLFYLPPPCSWWAHCTVPSQSDHWPSHCTEMYPQSPHHLSCRTWKLTCRTTAWVLHSYSYTLPVHEGILLFVVWSSQPLTDINCICHWTVCGVDNASHKNNDID